MAVQPDEYSHTSDDAFKASRDYRYDSHDCIAYTGEYSLDARHYDPVCAVIDIVPEGIESVI